MNNVAKVYGLSPGNEISPPPWKAKWQECFWNSGPQAKSRTNCLFLIVQLYYYQRQPYMYTVSPQPLYSDITSRKLLTQFGIIINQILCRMGTCFSIFLNILVFFLSPEGAMMDIPLRHRVQTDSGAHRASYTMGTTSSFAGGGGGLSSRCLKLTPHLHPMPRLRMRRYIPPFLQYVLMAWYLIKQQIGLRGVVLS
jgi:hypothetical protein